jgi:D-serine deaminase-like pyridoxal phosphate-dependent protein
MEFSFDNLEKIYAIKSPEKIRTPRLVVFEERVDFNITRMENLVKEVGPSKDISNICSHVKTHKSVWVTKKLLKAGITFFKASINEVEMLIEAGAKEIFVAYPLLPADVKWLVNIVKAFSDVRFYVQVGHKAHVDYLLSVEINRPWNYFIDVNVGMDRTGIYAEEAFNFYRSIPESNRLNFIGLHAYDGHNHDDSLDHRDEIAADSMGRLVKATDQFLKNNIALKKNVVGGTPSFLHDLKFLSNQKYDIETYFSPGTWTYFDTKYFGLMPDTFQPAAFVLSQVMDKPSENRATLNAGHKRWGADQGPVELFSVAGMKAVNWSEEHTVVTVPPNQHLKIGDYVLIAPRHVCTTVNLWDYFTIIDQNGLGKKSQCPVDARNR